MSPRDKKEEDLRRRWGDDGRDDAQDNTQTNLNTQKESDGVRIDDFIKRAEPLIEQVNNLYRQFAVGTEILPPNERRKQLEQLMATLSSIAKPNQTYRFKVNTVVTRFHTYRDRWDKILKDLESGKIKRTTGPKKSGPKKIS